VLFVIADPDDDHVRLLGTAKSNLGRVNLPTLSFRIVGTCVAETSEGPVWTGKLEWLGESTRTVREAAEATAAAANNGDRTAAKEAADWLHDYLTSQGGVADSVSIKRQGGKLGHSNNSLARARRKLRVATDARGFPRKTYWLLSAANRNGTAGDSEQVQQVLLTPTVTCRTSRAYPKHPSLCRYD
jgi:hypothetical protein